MESKPSSSTVPCENHISFNLPAFGASNPRVWFTQIEAYFRFRRITTQETMFSYVATQLPTDIATEVIDVLDPMPTEFPYDTLKAAVLKRTTASDESRLKQLLSGVELGDRSPSQLLRHMRTLVGSYKVDDSVLRQLWTKCLPPNTVLVLSVQGDETSLDKLAELADKVHECFFKHPINQVSQPTNAFESTSVMDRLQNQIEQLTAQVSVITKRLNRRRSVSPGRNTRALPSNRDQLNRFCYFHKRFGDAARNCRPWCSHPKAFRLQDQQGNSPASQ
ncbi:unnamed protein product [Dicrocoelium dendriticum]|nr:unnamed protein product [Dicrocoelium dendriticum]